jgi:hypothetical protein
MNYRKTIKMIMHFVFFFVVFVAFAQGPSEIDETNDSDNVPLDATIDYYILPMVLLGIATATLLLKKRAAAKPL